MPKGLDFPMIQRMTCTCIGMAKESVSALTSKITSENVRYKLVHVTPTMKIDLYIGAAGGLGGCKDS